MSNTLIVYLSSIFLVVYGLLSIIAGIKNKKKSFWISLGFDDTKKILKENYDRVNNIVWGTVSFLSGITIIIMY
ncbi:hypothetical protein CAP36_00160 [Chitinophagaceae bacterium IBVUCB2]|nr:hypothetical protein CAP36_00160 [Chitinophagaceae bacterium IBVUCB2]